MFANKIAIVTGGGSGIGRALCRLLAKEKASIIVADRNINGVNETISSMEKSSSNQFVGMEVDVSKIDSVKSMFEAVNKNFGTNEVATLIANVAGVTKDGWLIKMPEEDLDYVMNINFKGTFYTVQEACKIMIDKKVDGGSIVNVSSVSAKTGNMGQANYCASKSAVEGLTRNVASEMGKYNIRCNCIVPGGIETPIIETIPEKLMMGMLYMTPLGRLGKPEEVAEAIKFFLSDQSSYITGTKLQVSGGFAM